MRYAVAIAEERSFTRAAVRCHVVQSALSHQIAALERELGVALFARSSRRVEVTSAGEAFVAAARESLEAAERASAEAAAAVGWVRGVLTIGMIPTVTTIDLAGALAEFRETYPQVRVRVREGSSDEFMASIAAGEMDVAVLGLAEATPPRGVAWRELHREHLVSVLSKDHRSASRSRMALADLADETFVDFPEGAPGRAQSDIAFSAAGLRRDVAFEVMSIELMLELVRRNLALALLSPAVVPDDSTLRTVPLDNGPRRIEYLAWSDFNPSPAARAFLDGLRQ